jgi:hypothetical protein
MRRRDHDLLATIAYEKVVNSRLPRFARKVPGDD